MERERNMHTHLHARTHSEREREGEKEREREREIVNLNEKCPEAIHVYSSLDWAAEGVSVVSIIWPQKLSVLVVIKTGAPASSATELDQHLTL